MAVHQRARRAVSRAAPPAFPASVQPILWSLITPLVVVTLGTGLQVGTPDPSEHTALEQALIEHACIATRPAGAPGTDAHQDCLDAQLLVLRTDFGRDLSRLSSAERKTLDSVCSALRTTRGRDAYVGCLSGELNALRNRRKRASPSPSEATPLPLSSPSPPPADAAPPAAASSGLSAVWIGAAIAIVLAAAGCVLFVVKARRGRRICRVCGGVAERGDLCQKCRHDAAEGVRRAATERADEQRAQEEEQRRLRERHEEQRRQKAREDQDARLREQEDARQREARARQRLEEEARLREGPAGPSGQTAMALQDVFDPYAVLGVSRDASKEAIGAAYQAARLKYEPDQVAHLSVELQEHYKVKAQAVDRAYQMLTQ